MECYENDFEDFLLKDTTEYYSVKAQSWIFEDSCQDYMIKVPRIKTFLSVCICIYVWLFLNVRCFFQMAEECSKRMRSMLVTICILAVNKSYWRYLETFLFQFCSISQLIFYLQQVYQFRIQNVATSFFNSARHISPYGPYIVIILNFNRKCKMNCFSVCNPLLEEHSRCSALLHDDNVGLKTLLLLSNECMAS
jgi:hypothetical protein